MEHATTTIEGSALIAGLNDLLQLDHDAVEAYSLAIARMGDAAVEDALKRYREDHERHIRELTEAIHRHGGVPAQLPHLPSGAFKLAVQGLGALAGTRATLLAFKANERQVRDKYTRAAQQRWPEDVQLAIHRAARDEETHYAWATETLNAMGAGADSTAGRVEQAVEVAHARMADVLERGERAGMRGAETARRGVMRLARENPFGAVLLAVGTGVLAGVLLGREGRR